MPVGKMGARGGFGSLGPLGGTTLALPRGLAVYGNNSPAQVATFETFLGSSVSLVLAFFDQTTNAAFTSSATSIPTLQGGRACIWSVPICGADSTIAATNTGTLDATFTACANTILANHPAGVAIMVRIGWEFSLSTQPWYAGGAKEAAYISAFQRIVGLFRAKSKRFRFDWCPNVGSVASMGVDPVNCYPGDTYVDVIGMDLYHTAGVDNAGQQGLADYTFKKNGVDRGLDWLLTFAATHGKPWALTENGNNGPEEQRYNIRGSGFTGGIYDWIRDNPPQYHGHWEGTHNAVSTRISNGDNPKIAALYLKAFAAPTIETPATWKTLVNVQATVPLKCYQTCSWSIVSGTATINSTTGVLTVPAQGAGTAAITVRATNRYGYSTTKAMSIVFVSAYSFVNAEASTYFAAWTTAPHEGYKEAVDALITAFKSASYYTTLKDLVILCGPNSVDSKRRFITPASSVTTTGTETFEAFRGFSGLVSPASAIDTGIVYNAASPFAQNSAHTLVWSTNDIQSNSSAAGPNSGNHIIPRSAANQLSCWCNDFTDLLSANTNGKGVYINNRSAVGARQQFKDSTLAASDVQASSGLAATNFLILSTNAFPDEWQVGMWAAGSSVGATNTIPTAVTTAIRTFADTIGAPY